MIWCEHCRDHYDEEHYTNEGHKVGSEYGPTGSMMVKEQFVDLVLGENAVLWQNTPDNPRVFEVRRDGWHVGFVEVTAQGEVVWA